MKRLFFFNENFQIMCCQRSKTHSKYIIDVLLQHSFLKNKRGKKLNFFLPNSFTCYLLEGPSFQGFSISTS
jgi:hypothetical protein